MNFQNIPRDLKVVKQAFIPKEQGWALSFLDYSQVEPRFFAYFSARLGDDTIAQWYSEGRDVYREIAARARKKAPEDVTPEERQTGKVWFLMSLYGAGPKKMAAEIGMPLEEAKQFYRDFHEGLPQIKMLSNPRPKDSRIPWEPGAIERAYLRRGYIKTPWGRRLHAEQFGEHKLLNKLIQGSAADLMKAALIRVDGWLREVAPRIGFDSHMVSVVHDEIQFDGPDEEVPRLHDNVPRLMRESFIEEFVPIEVDHDVSSTTWAQKIPYEEWLATQEVAA